jgi:HSP20 family protein
MRLVPYFRKLETAETGRLFEDFFKGFPFDDSRLETGESWMPSVDILENNGNIILRAELPGMTDKDIELKLEGSILTLKGERKMGDDPKSTFHRIESYHGSFTRSFRLPETVDMEKIGAEYKNGVLTVTLPQKPEVKPREISITVH